MATLKVNKRFVETLPEREQEYYELEFKFDNGLTKLLKLTEESYKAIESYFKPKATRKEKKPAPAPTLQEVKDYFKSEGYMEDTAIRFHKYYESSNWVDANNKPVLRWKSKAISTWFKPENKIKEESKPASTFFQR